MSLSLPAHLGEVLRRAQGGSVEAAAKVFELCKEPLGKYVRRIIPAWLRPLYDVDDCVNDTVDEICRERYPEDTLRSREHLEARIKTTARHNVRDEQKKNEARKRKEGGGTTSLDDVDEPAGHDSSPEEAAIDQEMLERRPAELARCMPSGVHGIVPLWLAREKRRDIARKLGLDIRQVYRWIEWLEENWPK